jgi:hypothetical protein
MSVQKRKRERDKAERAAQKREERAQRESSEPEGDAVATVDDLEGYGILPDAGEDEDQARHG